MLEMLVFIIIILHIDGCSKLVFLDTRSVMDDNLEWFIGLYDRFS